jgi:hypothetical protein
VATFLGSRFLPSRTIANHAGVKLSIIFLAFRGTASDKNQRDEINNLARSAAEKNLVLEQCI